MVAPDGHSGWSHGCLTDGHTDGHADGSKAVKMARSKATIAMLRMREELHKTLNLAVRRDAANAIAKVAFALGQKGISDAKNPMGRKWKPLKSGHGLPLRYLVGSLRLRMGFMQFEVSEGRAHASYHQKGARRRDSKWKLPARSFLPRGKALPKPWAEKMLEEFSRYSKRLQKFTQKHVSGIVKV